jgi:DNA-binding IclR family transcriptional regulator
MALGAPPAARRPPMALGARPWRSAPAHGARRPAPPFACNLHDAVGSRQKTREVSSLREPADRQAATAGIGAESNLRSAYASTRRALQILDVVASQGEGLNARELAAQLGISVSSCYQMLAILIDEGYLEKLPHRSGYRLGPKVGELLERARGRLDLTAVGPAMAQVAHHTGHPAYFAVRSANGDAVIARVCTPARCPPLGIPEGFIGPAHALALGKVLLAEGGPGTLERYRETHDLRSFTERTITDTAKLRAHIRRVSERGYATDFEEFADNLYCLAVPVRSADSRFLGALGIGMTPTRDLEELRAQLRLLRRAAQEIARTPGAATAVAARASR